jgi:deoxyribodipyrimidine photo-lyase
MTVGVVLFTRDLRVHDNPALSYAAREYEQVLPMFVLDDDIRRGGFNRPNRAAFLADCLRDLDGSLRARGARLVVRRGDVVAETARLAERVGARAVHVAGDVSRYAQRRERHLAQALTCELVVHEDALFAVPPGRIRPSGGGAHMSVFSAYYRRWLLESRRAPVPAPRVVELPDGSPDGRLPSAHSICSGPTAPRLPPGGESAGRSRLSRWLREDAGRYDQVHDDLAADATSRLSPYLHFGCLSPVDVLARSGTTAGFARQLAWRDFHAQVLAARSDASTRDLRPREDRWRDAPAEFDAWRQGCTGIPVVDAGMRQLAAEGWLHNRARLLVAHFLTKTLYLDWRLGAAHFAEQLVDGDVANNSLNWQWVAGTGTDSRYNRVYNICAQGRRYDPDGAYVRRHVPELREVPGAAVHEPWRLPGGRRAALDYPDPIVDVAEGNARFLRARGKG